MAKSPTVGDIAGQAHSNVWFEAYQRVMRDASDDGLCVRNSVR
jgi:hypothetical protein